MALSIFAAWMAFACLGAPSDVLAQAAERVGEVAALRGRAIVIHAGSDAAERLSIDSPVFMQDIVQTAPGSAIKLEFSDGTVVSLGEETTMKVTKYVFSSADGKRESLLVVPEGIIRAIVQKLFPGAGFRIRTMTSVSAARGTDWMAEATPGATATIVLQGEVAITSANPLVDGEVVLRRGEGISVELDDAPATKSQWGQARVASFRNRTAVE